MEGIEIRLEDGHWDVRLWMFPSFHPSYPKGMMDIRSWKQDRRGRVLVLGWEIERSLKHRSDVFFCTEVGFVEGGVDPVLQ